MDALHRTCRTCLRELDTMFYSLDHVEQFEDISLTTKLSACVPEMNLDSWSLSLCFSCTATLRLAYEFRKMCLATEVHIQNLYQNQPSDNKISIVEQPIIKTESVSPNESEVVEIKNEDIYLEEDEDDWLRANGYFNSNFDNKDFEETDTAESDSYEPMLHNPASENLTNEINNTSEYLESDTDSIIKKCCENIKVLKERNITPENLQCQVIVDKLPERYSNGVIEDTTAAIVRNDESNKLYSCDQCKSTFSNYINYQNHSKCECVHAPEIGLSMLKLLQHIKNPKETSELKCSYCNRAFVNNTSYVNHQMYHINRICCDCHIQFTTKEQLYDHTKAHEKQDSAKNKDVNKKLDNVLASTSSTSEEQFSRIIVSEDVFEKAVKSFSKDFFDEVPPIIEKYCCSGNCNCTNKNSKNCVKRSDFFDELSSILPLKKIGNNLLFSADSVRKSKEIARKNIKKVMSKREYRKHILKQGIHSDAVFSEHNYCKPCPLSKKKKKKRKKKKQKIIRLKKSRSILDKSNVAKYSFNSCDVSDIKQTENAILQQAENSETTNTIQYHNKISSNVANGDIINEPKAKKNKIDSFNSCDVSDMKQTENAILQQAGNSETTNTIQSHNKISSNVANGDIINEPKAKKNKIDSFNSCDVSDMKQTENAILQQAGNSETTNTIQSHNKISSNVANGDTINEPNAKKNKIDSFNSCDVSDMKQTENAILQQTENSKMINTIQFNKKISSNVANGDIMNEPNAKKNKIDSFNSCDVSDMKQIENAILQQTENSKMINIIQFNNKISSNVASGDIMNEPNAKKNKIERNIRENFELSAGSDRMQQRDLLSERNIDHSKGNNETSYSKIRLQKTSTESLGIKNMSLADLLQDTVNVNSQIRRDLNSDVVTLKDLLNNSNDPLTSLHVVTPFNDSVTNYALPNYTDLTEEKLNILINDACSSILPGKKTRPKILKEVLNKTVIVNLLQPRQKPVPIHDYKLQSNRKSLVPIECINNLQSIASETIGSEENKSLPTLKAVTSSTNNLLQRTQSQVVPIHDNKLQSNQKSLVPIQCINNLQSIASETIGSEENKSLPTLKAKTSSTNNLLQRIQSQVVPIHDNKLQSNQKSLVPIKCINNLQSIASETIGSEENKSLPTLKAKIHGEFSNSIELIDVSTNESKRIKITIPSSTKQTSSTNNLQYDFEDIIPFNAVCWKANPVPSSSHISNTDVIQPSTSSINFKKSKFDASYVNTKKIKRSDLSTKTNVINKTLPENYPKQNCSFDSTDKSIINANSDSGITNTGPKNHQKESTSFLITLKNADNNKSNGNPDKSTVSDSYDSALTNKESTNPRKASAPFNNESEFTIDSPANQQKEAKLFPITLKHFNKKKGSSNSNKETVSFNNNSELTDKESIIQQKESTAFSTTLKHADNKNNSGNSSKQTVSVNNDSVLINAAIENQRIQSASSPTTLKLASNKRSGDITIRPIVNSNNYLAITNEEPANQQKESTPLTVNDDIVCLLESDSDDDDAIVVCDNRNDHVSEKGNNIVDLTTDTDTFSVNFNYMRDQMESSSPNAPRNRTDLNHCIKVKSFDKKKRAAATATTQSSIEKSNEQRNRVGNDNPSQTMLEAVNTIVSEISLQKKINVPETLENTAPNVEYVDPIPRNGNSENRKNTTSVGNSQKKNDSTKNVGHPIEVIALTKRDYDREIKKLFNLNFKPLSSSLNTQKCDIQNKKTIKNETKNDETIKDDQSNGSKTETSSSDCERRPGEMHNNDKIKDNKTLLYSNHSTSSIHEKNNNENNVVFDSDQLSSTFDENPHVSKCNGYALDRNASDSSEQRDKFNSNALVSSTFRRKTFDKKENLIHENTTTTDINDVTDYLSQIADKLFETISATNMELVNKEKVMETTDNECISKKNIDSVGYIAKQKENKSSNQKVRKYAINVNASASDQQLIDETLSEQASSTDLSKPATSKESDNATQQRRSKNKSLLNLDFELFHSQLCETELKKVRRSTDVNSKLNIRNNKLNNKNTSKVKSEFKKKRPFKKLESEMVKKNQIDSNESEQVITAKGFTERKNKIRCRVCRKCFDYKFQRELHECQFFFYRSAKKKVKDTTCGKCGNVFTNEILKNMHVCQMSRSSSRNSCKESVKLTCTVCNKIFSSRNLLIMHMNDVHEKPEDVLTMDVPSERTLKCFFCKKSFKNGIYRFLHLLRHFSFRKHKCRKSKGVPLKQMEYKKQSGKIRKYRLSELADVLHIGNVELMKICKPMQKQAFLKVLNKILNYLHLVRCRKCNRISGGWFNETLQSYFIKWRYLHKKPFNGKTTNKHKRDIERIRNYGLRRSFAAGRIKEKNETVHFPRKQTYTLKRRLNVNKVINGQMLKVMSDLNLSAKEMNFYTSDALKSKTYKKAGYSETTEDNDSLFSDNIDERMYQLFRGKDESPTRVTLTNDEQVDTIEEHMQIMENFSQPKRVTCKYCLLKFKDKLTLQMHKETNVHRHNVALLQKSECEIEQDLLMSINQPQTMEDTRRAIRYIMNKIKMIKKYHCKDCSESFISRNQLEMHRKIHKD